MKYLFVCGMACLAFGCKDSTEPLDLAGAPVTLVAVSGAGQTGAVGTALESPIVVRVVDSSNKPVPGIEVSWSTSAGSLSPVSDESDADGEAATVLTLPATSGDVTVTATVDGIEPIDVVVSATPTAGGLQFRYVEVGSYHACAITTAEESICWGFNEDGEVGAGTFSQTEPLTRVSTNRSVRITSAGRYHSCEVTLSGDVWCGGSNTEGQLDGQPGPPSAAFIRVQPLPATAFRVVASGLSHTCALSLSQQLWCWGATGEGQVGTGVDFPGTFIRPPDGFVGNGFRAVSATGLHTCALTTSGQAECWGWNASGQLGDGTQTQRAVPTPVAGGTTFRTEPNVVPPAPDPDFYIPGQAFLSAGFAHTCAIRADDRIACWGENENGQLGTGNTTDVATPTLISSSLQFRAVSSGYRHTCAIATDGAAYCWGDNALGQLGDGSRVSSAVPVAVGGGLLWQSISAGDTFSCGVTTAAALYCWGDNVYRQLGAAGPLSPLPLKLPFQP